MRGEREESGGGGEGGGGNETKRERIKTERESERQMKEEEIKHDTKKRLKIRMTQQESKFFIKYIIHPIYLYLSPSSIRLKSMLSFIALVILLLMASIS